METLLAIFFSRIKWLKIGNSRNWFRSVLKECSENKSGGAHVLLSVHEVHVHLIQYVYCLYRFIYLH